MLSKLKISTVDQWSGKTIRPVYLFLTMMLVIAYPGLSHSAAKQITEYRTGNFRKSQEGERSTLSGSEKRLYQQVKTVLEHQKRLISINKELTEKVALKNAIIKSLEYSEQLLWNQLEDSETIYWDALRTRDIEYKKAEKLNHQLTLKENIIKTLKDSEKNLKAQLEDNKKKFEIALAAIDPEYKPTEERAALIPESLFGYSPPATDGDHPWSSLVCVTCHGGDTDVDNEVNISAEIAKSSKNILWEDNIDVSDYMLSYSSRSSQGITNNYSKSNNLKGGDSISTFRDWTSPPSDTMSCNDQESDGSCVEDSKTDSWWHWFYQKISTLKTSVAETIYAYL